MVKVGEEFVTVARKMAYATEEEALAAAHDLSAELQREMIAGIMATGEGRWLPAVRIKVTDDLAASVE